MNDWLPFERTIKQTTGTMPPVGTVELQAEEGCYSTVLGAKGENIIHIIALFKG